MLEQIVLVNQQQQKENSFADILNDEVRQKITDIFKKDAKTAEDSKFLQLIVNELQKWKEDAINHPNASECRNVFNMQNNSINSNTYKVREIKDINEVINLLDKQSNMLDTIIKQNENKNISQLNVAYSLTSWDWGYYVYESWVEKFIDNDCWSQCRARYFQTLNNIKGFNDAAKKIAEWIGTYLLPLTEIEVNTGFPKIDGILKLGQAIISFGWFIADQTATFTDRFIPDIIGIANNFNYEYTKSIIEKLDKLWLRLKNEVVWLDKIRPSYWRLRNSIRDIKTDLRSLYLIAEKKYSDSQNTDYFGGY